MDSITQAALGAVVGEVILARKLGWRGAVWGAFFGTLPDLDILAYPLLDEVGQIKWHRGISHSILAMVIATVVLAWPLAKLHRKRGLSTTRAGWFIFFAWSTHVLIDVFTTYGTQVFEPFSSERVAFNNLSIIDPLFTLPLLLCLFLVFRHEPGSEIRRKIARVCVSLTFLYTCFSFVMKGWAVKEIDSRMKDEIPGARLVSVAPSILNTLLWRGLMETEDFYFVTYWSPFDDDASANIPLAKQRHLAKPFEEEPLFKALKWFSRDHWVAHAGNDGTVVFVDVRFGEMRDLKTRKLLPTFQWHMRYDESGEFVAPLMRPASINPKANLSLLWNRIWGDQGDWQDVEGY